MASRWRWVSYRLNARPATASRPGPPVTMSAIHGDQVSILVMAVYPRKLSRLRIRQPYCRKSSPPMPQYLLWLQHRQHPLYLSKSQVPGRSHHWQVGLPRRTSSHLNLINRAATAIQAAEVIIMVMSIISRRLREGGNFQDRRGPAHRCEVMTLGR